MNGFSIARANVLGLIGQDPEYKFLKDGREYANFSVCVTKSKYNGESKQYENNPMWVKISIFNDATLKFMKSNQLGRGSKVYIDGELEIKKVESVYHTSIVIGFDGSLIPVEIKKASEVQVNETTGVTNYTYDPFEGDIPF